MQFILFLLRSIFRSMYENFDTILKQVKPEASPEIDINQLLTNRNQSNSSAADVFPYDDFFLNMYRDKPDFSTNHAIEDGHLEYNVKVSDNESSDEYFLHGLKSNFSAQNSPWLSPSSFKASPKFDVGKSRLPNIFRPTSSSQISYKPSRSQEMFFKNKFADCRNATVLSELTQSEFQSQNFNARPHGPILNNFTGKIDVRSKLKIDALKDFENTPKRKLGKGKRFPNYFK